VEEPVATMGSEDFSVYLKHVPRGAQFRFGLGAPGRKHMHLHNDQFDFNNDALPLGTAILARLARMIRTI
jgi:metal-dependent amidase/aminoacylase/carboxypeptidase family protein